MCVQLSEIFTYGEENGVVCCYCRDAKATGDFTTGKVWNDVWKLDFLKRHLSSKSHTDSVTKLRSKNPTSRGDLFTCCLKAQPKKKTGKLVLNGSVPVLMKLRFLSTVFCWPLK